MPQRQGNRPDRRIEPAGAVSTDVLNGLLARVRHEGSGHHKLHPADYGFKPPINPRGSKSVCDDIREILSAEAKDLFESGIKKGMISKLGPDGIPKYVWAVDLNGEVYEAKIGGSTPEAYHGYRLRPDDGQRDIVLKEWKRR